MMSFIAGSLLRYLLLTPAFQLAATDPWRRRSLTKPQSVTCLGDLIHNVPLPDSSERSL